MKGFDFEITERDKNTEQTRQAYYKTWRGKIDLNSTRYFIELHRITGVVIIFFQKRLDFLLNFIYNEKCKNKIKERTLTMKDNNSSKTPKGKQSWLRPSTKNVIIGLWRLVLILSIGISTWHLVTMSGDDIFPKLVTIPMSLFAVTITAKQFVKGDK